jgi:hypothetical protein
MTDNKLKQDEELLKVYALLVEAREVSFLSVQYAASLEEALVLAKREFEKSNPIRSGINNPLIGSKIGLFTIKDVDELVMERESYFEDLKTSKQAKEKGDWYEKEVSSVKKAEKVELTKSELMREIINKKDFALFELKKKTFTVAERKYIQTHLNKEIK